MLTGGLSTLTTLLSRRLRPRTLDLCSEMAVEVPQGRGLGKPRRLPD
jgi:hypothetical protein